jgi:hypothetical protein
LSKEENCHGRESIGTRAELERQMDAARQLRAETLAGASRDFVAAAGPAVRRLLVRAVALAPRWAWLPAAADRRASGVDGPTIRATEWAERNGSASGLVLRSEAFSVAFAGGRGRFAAARTSVSAGSIDGAGRITRWHLPITTRGPLACPSSVPAVPAEPSGRLACPKPVRQHKGFPADGKVARAPDQKATAIMPSMRLVRA